MSTLSTDSAATHHFSRNCSMIIIKNNIFNVIHLISVVECAANTRAPPSITLLLHLAQLCRIVRESFFISVHFIVNFVFSNAIFRAFHHECHHLVPSALEVREKNAWPHFSARLMNQNTSFAPWQHSVECERRYSRLQINEKVAAPDKRQRITFFLQITIRFRFPGVMRFVMTNGKT